MSQGVIGHLSWNACEECVFTDGCECSFDEADVVAVLEGDGDDLICTHFQTPEDQAADHADQMRDAGENVHLRARLAKLERVAEVAREPVQEHIYEGACPNWDTSPTFRDPYCPECQRLLRMDAALAALDADAGEGA